MTDPIPIIFGDDRLVVVDKPPGLAVVPAAGSPPADSVRGVVERQLGVTIWVVHRLDRDTSGVVLFARTADVHRALCAAFEERRVRKTYLAFTSGLPPGRDGLIETPLHAARRGKVRPALPHEAGAFGASTRFVVRKAWARDADRVALLEVHPETGRHHQIRAHLRSIGTPILFDRIYGREASAAVLTAAPAQRLALHASRLVVPDPASPGDTHAFEAALAPDLVALLHWLDGEWTEVAGGQKEAGAPRVMPPRRTA